ncbi:hypothetical protein WA026_005731 [Henosepilachna vigintioctopunctata]|uniref:Major facilitator superfamily (MFS) profile domain-containing protein n=1 Tax=Henosepilachna vigintioctopunctata TaxID=420089 RepID=A0AAW1TX96_9CUCU
MGNIMRWLPLISLMVFVAANSLIGIAPSLAGEFFSPEAKDVSMALGILFGGLSGFVTTFLFERVQNAIGLGETFFIFAGLCLVTVVFIIVFLIETRGKTLEEIQDELNNNRITAFK